MSGARERLAEELDRHHATIMGAHGRTTWLDCRCGWETVVTSATGRLAGARERWRLHRADALLPVVQALVAEGQAEALEAAAEAWSDSKLNAVPNLNGGLALFAVVSGLRTRANDIRKASS